MWNPWKGGWTAEILDGFHGMGDGIHGMGDGFHGMVDGFHGFSTWIPYGMSSWNHNSTLIHKFKPKYWVV